MLVHDNGKVCVASATRCGHTSMYHYFGRNPHTNPGKLGDWIESSSRKILVLRNPYDRLQSALINAEDFPYGLTDITLTKEEWIYVHSKPYLIDIPLTTNFEIIDFYKLSDYIQMSRDTMQTNVSSVNRRNLDITPEMRKEYDRYRYYMEHCKQIDPLEWKELTRN